MNNLIFPTKNAPKFLTDFGNNIADVYSVPIDFAIISLISAYATAIGNKAILKTGKYTNYPQFWFVVVAPSGTGKSKPLAVAYKPISDCENTEIERYSEDLKEWKKECFYATKNGDPKPEKPNQKRLICNDTTPEALFGLLSENPAITIYRDELAGFFNDIGRYNKSGEVAHYLSTFDNHTINIDRKSNDIPLYAKEPILSMIGTIQPEVMHKIADSNSMRENGFLQRCLFVYPDKIRSPKYSKKELNRELAHRHRTDIELLLNMSDTSDYRLSNTANELYIDFYNQMANEQDHTDIDYLKSLYAKMNIHVLRLALVLSAVFSETSNNVSENSMLYAIDLCGYFIETGKKMYQSEQPTNLTSGELYRMLHQTIGIKNQAQFAESLGITKQAVSKSLSKT